MSRNDSAHTIDCPQRGEAQQGSHKVTASPASQLLDLLEMLAAGSGHRHVAGRCAAGATACVA